MLRCAASFVIAAYAEVRLIPQDLRALPAELFTKPSHFQGFATFYGVVKIESAYFFIGKSSIKISC
jgi:hypothetical protein